MRFKLMLLMVSWGITLLITGGIYAASSSTVSKNQGHHLYKIYTSDVIPDIYKYSYTKIEWANNDTLIFKGYRGPNANSIDWLRSEKPSLYQWTIGDGVSSIEVDERWSGHFCVSNKGLMYRLKSQKKAKYIEYYEGPVGALKYKKKEVSKSTAKRSETCRPLSRGCEQTCRKDMVGHKWSPLTTGNGYFDFGSDDQKLGLIAPVTIQVGDKKEIVRTQPIALHEISTINWHFYKFKNAYFSWEFTTANPRVQSQWKKNNCMPNWWIWEDGKTERACVPAGPWVGPTSFSPLQNGIFFHSLKPNVFGGYLLSEGDVSKVVEGVIYRHSSSPDGCKVAFIHKNKVDDDLASLKVFDFCVTGHGD